MQNQKTQHNLNQTNVNYQALKHDHGQQQFLSLYPKKIKATVEDLPATDTSTEAHPTW